MQEEDHANDHSAIREDEGTNELGPHTQMQAALPHGRHPSRPDTSEPCLENCPTRAGSPFTSIKTAPAETSNKNKRFSISGGICTTQRAPTWLPTMPATTNGSHSPTSTWPWRQWVKAPNIAGRMNTAREVPAVTRRGTRSTTAVRGTRNTPPPTPKKPESRPVARPQSMAFIILKS